MPCRTSLIPFKTGLKGISLPVTETIQFSPLTSHRGNKPMNVNEQAGKERVKSIREEIQRLTSDPIQSINYCGSKHELGWTQK